MAPKFYFAPPTAFGADVGFTADSEVIAGYLHDAAHFPGGHAEAVARPASAEAACEAWTWARARGMPVYPAGARSSLTGGATPRGGLVLSTERLRRLEILDHPTAPCVTVGAGVTLHELAAALAERGLWYPPAPTFDGATVGGTLATNAAGAATHLHGTTRRFVEALSLLLPTGERLDLARGQFVAPAGGVYRLDTATGHRTVPAPGYALPRVAKVSGVYWSEQPLDLVDLFVGSEGTLGLVLEARLRVARLPPGVAVLAAACRDDAHALDVQEALLAAFPPGGPHGAVRSAECFDAASTAHARAAQAAPPAVLGALGGAAMVLLVEIETTTHDALETLEAAEACLRGVCGADGVLVAGPDDAARRRELHALREAIPAAINRATGARGLRKVAGDMCVPRARLAEHLRDVRAAFAARGLVPAVFGHLSDGNLHPNLVARDESEAHAGREALREIAARVLDMGGSTLAEHGAGRDPLKLAFRRMMLGAAGEADMRAVKHALDPEGCFAPGVLFEKESGGA